MKLMTLFLLQLLVSTVMLGQRSMEPVFYKSTQKKQFTFVEQQGELFTTHEMVRRYGKEGYWFVALRIDTLARVTEQSYVGNFSTFKLGPDGALLKLEGKKPMRMEIEPNNSSVYNMVNAAYFTQCHNRLYDSLKSQFPLYNYPNWGAHNTWYYTENKTQNPSAFKKDLDPKIASVKDSIIQQQTRFTRITHHILNNIDTLEYVDYKDSLAVLPVEWKQSSWYFGSVLNAVARQKPEHFFRIAEDFPADREQLFYMLESDDKQMLQSLNAVKGHDRVKKELKKFLKYNKTFVYRVLAPYVILGGLLTWLIIAQPG